MLKRPSPSFTKTYDDPANIASLPDIHEMFASFNEQYFEGLLSSCILEWSNKMTLCAGICYLRKQGTSRYCVIRLSRPLLTYRPFSDTVNTLLHEMIHAYLWIRTSQHRPTFFVDRDGHGPDFQAVASRINQACGSSITIYHTFHAEVAATRTHVWRCNGSCQSKAPYFGFVRRSMNRPPQPADSWWNQHQMSCGGTFTKVSAPVPVEHKKALSNIAKPKVPAGQSKITSWTNTGGVFSGTPKFAKDTSSSGIQCPACRDYLALSMEALNLHLDICLAPSTIEAEEVKVCPVCCAFCSTDVDRLNDHLDRCLDLTDDPADDEDKSLFLDHAKQSKPDITSFKNSDIIDLS